MDALTRDEERELGAALEALRIELAAFLEASIGGSRPVDLAEPIGRLSRMDALQQQSMSKANRETAKLRLQRVEAALARVGSGAYGDCLRCEEPVGYERLRVQPEAVLCIGCQGASEDR